MNALVTRLDVPRMKGESVRITMRGSVGDELSQGSPSHNKLFLNVLRVHRPPLQQLKYAYFIHYRFLIEPVIIILNSLYIKIKQIDNIYFYIRSINGSVLPLTSAVEEGGEVPPKQFYKDFFLYLIEMDNYNLSNTSSSCDI